MRIKNKSKLISYIMFILSLILIIKGFASSYKYSGYYDKAPEVIVNEYNNLNEFLFSSEIVEDNSFKSNFLLLSGSVVLGNINSSDTDIINVKLVRRTGKVKLLLWDEKNNVLISKNLSNSEEEIGIKPGEYQVIIVGKWFTGKIVFNNRHSFVECLLI